MIKWIASLVGALCALYPVGEANATSPGSNGRIVLQGSAGGSDAGRSESNIYSLSPDGSDLDQLTHDDGSHSPAVSPNGYRIAFLCGGFVSGKVEVCVMRVDGTDRKRLTRNRTFDGDPSWSSDGSRILFSRYVESARSLEVFTMSPRGRGVRRVTHSKIGEGTPVWKPTADRIAYVRGDHSKRARQDDVFTVGPEGEHRRRITRSQAPEEHLDWHPAGKSLVFVRNDNLFIKRVGAKGSTPLTSGPAIDTEPTWSPDGRFITFHRAGSVKGRSGLMKIEVESRQKDLLLRDPVKNRRCINPGLCYYTSPSWQPNN